MNSPTTPRPGIRVAVRVACGALLLALIAGCSSSERVVSLGDTAGSAERVAPTPGVLSKDPWTFGAAKGEVVHTANYRVFTTEKNPIIKDRMIAFVEYAIARYRTAFAPLPGPSEKLDTYLMDNRGQWEQLTQRLMGDQAKQLSMIQRGGFASRGIGVYYDLGLFDTIAIASHEGWHQYTQRTFKDPLPTWLEEGVAVYMEGHRWSGATPLFVPWGNLERFDQLRKAKGDGSLIPFDQLLASRPQDYLGNAGSSLLTYYAQLWALTHFLNSGEGGKYAPSFQALLSDAARGSFRSNLVRSQGERAADSAMATRTGPAAFLAYFSPDIDAVGKEYAVFVERLVAPGTRDLVVAGKTPEEALTPTSVKAP